MTIGELAEKMNVSRQALSKQINGNLMVSTVNNMAEALDVPLASLFNGYPTHVTCPRCKRIITESEINGQEDSQTPNT